MLAEGVKSDGGLKAFAASADGELLTTPGTLTPLGYQQITSLAAAAALTVPTGATMAFMLAESQGVRWRDDGVNPTASVGMPIAAGESIPYVGDLAAIRIIEQTASAKLNISYYG